MKFFVGKEDKLVALFILFAILLLAVFFILSLYNKGVFDEKLYYYTYSNFAGGFEEGTPIELLGIKIGQITLIGITDQNKLRIDFYIKQKYAKKMKTGSTLSSGAINIISTVLGGVKKLELQPGNGPGYIEPGSYVEMKSSNNIMDLINNPKAINQLVSDIQELIKQFKLITKLVEDNKNNINSSINSINELLKRLNEKDGTIQQLMRKDSTISNSIENLLENLRSLLTNINPLLEEIRPVVKIIPTMRKSMDTGIQQASKLVDNVNILLANIDTSIAKANYVADNVNILLDNINKKKGVAGQLINGEKYDSNVFLLITQVNETLHNVNEITSAVKEIADSIPSEMKGFDTMVINTISEVNKNIDLIMSNLKMMLSNVNNVIYGLDYKINKTFEMVDAIRNTWPINSKIEYKNIKQFEKPKFKLRYYELLEE